MASTDNTPIVENTPVLYTTENGWDLHTHTISQIAFAYTIEILFFM
jgi:hypothetical protein